MRPHENKQELAQDFEAVMQLVSNVEYQRVQINYNSNGRVSLSVRKQSRLIGASGRTATEAITQLYEKAKQLFN